MVLALGNLAQLCFPMLPAGNLFEAGLPYLFMRTRLGIGGSQPLEEVVDWRT